ncbi:unnamed protein product [Victoria cruziana]
MASLTPGVLLKLLEGLKSKDTVPSGDHKPILLQVISIVPALTGSGLWPSQGYFLKVSDSSHSTYVSLTAEDNDLICTDKLHLGQFIYIDKLVEGNPVPSALGVRPLHGRHPFVGTPKDLMQMVVVSEVDDCEPLAEKKVGNSAGGGGWDGDNGKLNIRASIKEEKVSVASRYLKSFTDRNHKKDDDDDGERQGGNGKKVEELGVAKVKSVRQRSGINEVGKDRGIKNRSIKEQKEQEVVRRRNVTSFAAALALEEATSAESLVKCVSMLSSLQSSSSSVDIPLTLTKFFDLHKSLISAKKNSSLTLFSGKDKLSTSKVSQNRSSCIVSIETPQKEKIEWKSGDGGREIQELRVVLLKESESWFLNFLGKELDAHDRRTPAGGKSRQQGTDVRSTIGIPEMKSINDWLDGWLVRKKEEGSEVGEANDTLERLKKKCYEYLLSQ